VFLRDAKLQRQATPTSIEFQVGDTWAPATAQYLESVRAVRLTQFNGSVDIRFKTPQRVKLSAEDWKDTYITRASCRNLMVDLRAGSGAGQAFQTAAVAYTIRGN